MVLGRYLGLQGLNREFKPGGPELPDSQSQHPSLQDVSCIHCLPPSLRLTSRLCSGLL